jgi:NifU-like protein involved in Fe-S cluster formation
MGYPRAGPGGLFRVATATIYSSQRQAPERTPAETGGPDHMLDDIYNRQILQLAADIPRLGRLEHPDASATAHSKLCGSTVSIDLAMDGDIVTDFAHEVKACALGQASSSIMARHVVGSTAAELRELRAAMRRMLKENGAPPTGKWEDLRILEPVRDYRARHASTMLTFDAVVDAVDQIEAARVGGSTEGDRDTASVRAAS